MANKTFDLVERPKHGNVIKSGIVCSYKYDPITGALRDCNGHYVRWVAKGYSEIFGRDYFETYFEQIGALLKPSGKALIQAITIRDQDYESYSKRTDFINQYIFPGGCLPSVELILKGVASKTELRLDHMEDIGLHYARTLRDWYQRLIENRAKLPEVNQSERFMRMWTYYLLSCAGAFAERRIGTVQMLFAGPAADRDVAQPQYG